MTRALLLVAILAAGCAAPVVQATVIAPLVPPSLPTLVPASASAPALASTPDAVVAALVRAAQAAMALPEQVEVTVGGARYACFRWPLQELLRGRINADTLWQVYVREVRTDGRKLDFEVR